MIFHFANFFTAKFCHQNFAKILQNAKFRSCLITTQRRAFINFTRPAFGFMPHHESIKSLKESYPQLTYKAIRRLLPSTLMLWSMMSFPVLKKFKMGSKYFGFRSMRYDPSESRWLAIMPPSSLENIRAWDRSYQSQSKPIWLWMI